MATAPVEGGQSSSLQSPPSPSPQGVLRPTISSTRRSSRLPTACLQLEEVPLNVRVPSLPKLHRKGHLVSTKLCETRRKSYAGHVFDLSNSQEYYQFLEYNSLHDPHLRSYYYRKAMKEKFYNNGYITSDLHVICHSLKEYNAYRNFLEFEFMKLRKQQEDEVKERERKHKSGVREQSRTSAMDKEREENRKAFFLQQEKKLQRKQLLLRRRERKEEINKKKVLEERRMQREKNEIKREAEREKRRIQQLQREHTEMLRRKSLLRQNEVEDSTRRIHLVKMKQEERLCHLREIERRWQVYEDHAQKAKEEEEKRKAQEKDEREKRMRRREKIFQILQKREEERRQKVMEENHHQVEVLKQEADMLEKQWQERKVCEMMEWKEKSQKKIQHWQHHLEHQKEAWRKENEKHVEELLSHSNAPQLHTSVSRIRKISADSCKKMTQSPHLHGKSANKSLQNSKRPASGNTVRFETTPTVHILEEVVAEDEEEEEEEQFSEEETEDLERELECDSIEHTDSYHLQLRLQHSKEEASGSVDLEIVDAEESLISLSYEQQMTNAKSTGVDVKMSSNIQLREKDSINLPSGKESHDNERREVLDEAGLKEEGSGSVASLLVAERSTASDVVNQAMIKAVERATTP